MKNKQLLKLIIASVTIIILTKICFSYFISFNEFIKFLSDIYVNHGPLILFLSGFIESIILVGLYFPGSTIILLGATLAGAGIISLPSVIVWTTLGILLAYSLNYWLGKVGGDKFLKKFGLEETVNQARGKAEKSNLIYLWSTAHPNIGAVVAVALGIMKVNFVKFILQMTLTQFFWSTFWGVIFYFFGLALLNKIAIVTGIVIGIMLLFELYKVFLPKHKYS